MFRAARHRQHRHASARVFLRRPQRQRPEVRRGPQEDQAEQDPRIDRHRARRRSPADHRRESASRAANDDVLRRRALEPHRVDDRVEEDRERQQHSSKRRRGQRHQRHRQQRHDEAEAQRVLAADQTSRNRTRDRARHQRVDVGVVPHVERASRARAERHRKHGARSGEEVHLDRSDDETDQRGEDDQRHHARLHQAHIVHRARGSGDGRCAGDARFGHLVLRCSPDLRARAASHPVT